ncbi:hypothetical protein HPB49_008680 [Dermacentor silvarum]|uniref:Uncharacterized protein n=1 Tax=Dermacentor silvarum TaxID=543639 RepID=A0ACB8C8K2_DERSI|nr:hypothetical protein HPB49_008680 [Dermacentor silvarum]
MAKALHTVPNLSPTFYADDITLWTTIGNAGATEETLQAGSNMVAAHAATVGLACSPTKSELLILRPPKCRTDQGPPPKIQVTLDGAPIPEVEKMQILGILLQSNGKNTATITKLNAIVHQTMRLIRRIANRHKGMREHDTGVAS